MPKKITQDEAIKILKSKDKEFKRNYSYRKFIYKDSKTKSTVICPEHGEFQASFNTLTQGQGCPKCGGSYHYNQDEAIEILKAKDKKFGRNYDYRKFVYKGSQIKSTVICPEHGEFQAPFNNLTQGSGCPKCGILKRAESRKITQDEAIEILKSKDKEFKRNYDYKKFVYKDSKTKSTVICPEHGKFQVSFSNLTRGQGCPKCGILKSTDFKRISPDEAIKILKAKDKEFKRNYDYKKFVYKNSQTKSTVICPEHGEFQASFDKLTQGQGCPVCNESKGEAIIRGYLLKNKISFESQKKFDGLIYKNKLSYDFYIKKLNMFIEFNGRQHYEYIYYFHRNANGFKIQQKHDIIKKSYAKENGYKMLVISYKDFDKIKDILDEKVLKPWKNLSKK